MGASALSSLGNRFKAPKWDFTFNPEPYYRRAINALTRFFYRPCYIGFENIPAAGPAILVANHVSYVDGPIINAGCNRPIRYVIDDEIYRWPGVHYFMALNRAVPIAANRASVEQALSEIADGLLNGDIFCIFPEGQLTYTGSLGRFKPGIEWMLKRAPVPVIPIAISGLWGSVFSRKYLASRFRFLPRFGRKVTVICGPAIAPEKATINYLQQAVLRLKYSLAC